MLRKIAIVGAIFCFCVLYANSAYAKVTGMDIYDEQGGATVRTNTEFLWNEIPWLRMTTNNSNNIGMDWIWNSSTVNSYSIARDPSQVTWFSPADWDTIKVGRIGLWTVNAKQPGGPGGGNVTVSRSFTLNAAPEPISSILFLVGGAALIIKPRLRKKS